MAAKKAADKKVADKVAEVKKEVKEAAKVVETKAADVKKEVAKKAAPKKAAPKKAETKAEAKAEVFVQFGGSEFNAKEVLAAAKAAYAKDNKEAIKEITLYIKPEDNAAYYVVNGNVSGKLAL